MKKSRTSLLGLLSLTLIALSLFFTGGKIVADADMIDDDQKTLTTDGNTETFVDSEEEQNTDTEKTNEIEPTQNRALVEKIPVFKPVLNRIDARIGNKVSLTYKKADLDAVAAPGTAITDFQFLFDTEAVINSLEISSIEIPYISATDADGNLTPSVDIYLMTINENGRFVLDVRHMAAGSNQGVTFSKESIDKAVSEELDGKYPATMYFFIQPDIIDAPLGHFGIPATTITFDGDVVLNYTVVDKPNSNNSYYTYTMSTIDYYTTVIGPEAGDPIVIDENKKQKNLFFETSDIIVTSDVDANLNPGDYVELTFTIKNSSSLKNRLDMGVKVDGLELADNLPTTNSNDTFTVDLDKWVTQEDGYRLNLKSNNAWITFDGQSEQSFTQRFKVTDDFVGDKIVVNPYLGVYTIVSDRDYNQPLELLMTVTEPNYSVVYNANGANGDVPIDTTEYRGDDLVNFKENTLTNEGHSFIGWSLDKENTLNDGLSINEIIEMKRERNVEIVLYAVWEPDEVGEVITPLPETVKPVNPDTGIATSNYALPMIIVASASLLLVSIKKKKYNK